MDLGDHPLRETVAVELKSVVEHKEGEIEYISMFSFSQSHRFSILLHLIDFLNKTLTLNTKPKMITIFFNFNNCL